MSAADCKMRHARLHDINRRDHARLTTRTRRPGGVRLPFRAREPGWGRRNTRASTFPGRNTCISTATSPARSRRRAVATRCRIRRRSRGARRARRRTRACRSSPTTRATARTPRASGGWRAGSACAMSPCSTAASPRGARRAAARDARCARRSRAPMPVDARRWRWRSTARRWPSCASGRATCWSTPAARIASRAATRPSTRSPVTCPARATMPFTGNLGADGKFLPAGAAAPALDHAAGLAAAGRVDRHVRLGRHRLPQPARARTRRPGRRAALSGFVERVDPRSAAPDRDGSY